MTEKSLVMFDIGAVLLELTYQRFNDNVEKANPGRELKQLLSMYSQLELEDVRGKASEKRQLTAYRKEYLEKAKQIIDPEGADTSKTLEIIKTCWGGGIQDMIKLKKQIERAGYPVGIISNMGRFSYPMLKEKLPDAFTASPGSPAIFSFKVGVIKPDPQIYRLVPGRYQPVIFIDDKEAYLVAGEQAAGWKGIHYTEHLDPSELIRTIKGHAGNNTSTIKTAGSVDEVVKALDDWGIRI
jgi:FMN phosphatase YigB (HAD superfamily)